MKLNRIVASNRDVPRVTRQCFILFASPSPSQPLARPHATPFARATKPQIYLAVVSCSCS